MKTKKPIKLTPGLLRNIIEEEVKGFGKMKDADSEKPTELDADEQADGLERPVDHAKANGIKEANTLDGHVDYMKALKIEEARLSKRLARVREALQKGARKLVDARVV